MNSIIIHNSEISSNKIHIECNDPRYLHMKNILKTKNSDHLRGTIVDKGLATLKVESIDNNGVHLTIEDTKEGKTTGLHLYTSIVRPQSAKKIIEYGTTLGIQSFNFFRTDLTDKSYLTSSLYKNRMIQIPFLEAGLSQSKIFYKLPKITFSQKKLANATTLPDGTNLILSFNSQNIAKIPPEKLKDKKINLILGPERGFRKSEIEKFINNGAIPISLSQITLRSEVALIHASSQLELILGSEYFRSATN